MEEKLEKLTNDILKMKKVAIAFSGGLDSSFLSKISFDTLKDNALAITATSRLYPKWEQEESKKIAKKIGIKQIFFEFHLDEIKEFKKNIKNRCYYCKKELFEKIKTIAKNNKIENVLDGSNADDKYDYRPGIKALTELNIISPLMNVGLKKGEIRELSKKMGLETWDKPSFACLASRFPYGTEITLDRLEIVEKSENLLKRLGFKQFRVRYYKEIAKIEVLKEDFKKIIENSEMINTEFKKNGFKYITLDIQGYRSGSLNEVLDK